MSDTRLTQKRLVAEEQANRLTKMLTDNKADEEEKTKIQKDKLKFFCKNYDECMENISNSPKIVDNRTLKGRNSISSVKQFVGGVDVTRSNSTFTNLVRMTNREDIEDFFMFTENCIEAMRTMIIPEEKDIEHLKIKLSDQLYEEYEVKGKLAVFELDETLMHLVLEGDQGKKAEKYVKIKLSDDSETVVGINLRPGWRETLQAISKLYMCVIFTASVEKYAQVVLDELDPNQEIFKLRVYRDSCYEGFYDGNTIHVKDLRIFSGVDLKDIVLIGNNSLSFAHQLNNGIPIMPFYENKFDEELSCLTKFLEHLHTSDDVRKEIKDLFRLESLVAEVSEYAFKTQYESFSCNSLYF